MTVPKHKMWLTSEEAAEILTANSGHLVKSDYVRKLATMGHIATKRIDKRTLVYNRNQVESYIVSTTPGPRSAKKRVDLKQSFKPTGKPEAGILSQEEKESEDSFEASLQTKQLAAAS